MGRVGEEGEREEGMKEGMRGTYKETTQYMYNSIRRLNDMKVVPLPTVLTPSQRTYRSSAN